MRGSAIVGRSSLVLSSVRLLRRGWLPVVIVCAAAFLSVCFSFPPGVLLIGRLIGRLILLLCSSAGDDAGAVVMSLS
jgi:hypothetical protein